MSIQIAKARNALSELPELRGYRIHKLELSDGFLIERWDIKSAFMVSSWDAKVSSKDGLRAVRDKLNIMLESMAG